MEEAATIPELAREARTEVAEGNAACKKLHISSLDKIAK
jgi:hypothetical protein